MSAHPIRFRQSRSQALFQPRGRTSLVARLARLARLARVQVHTPAPRQPFVRPPVQMPFTDVTVGALFDPNERSDMSRLVLQRRRRLRVSPPKLLIPYFWS